MRTSALFPAAKARLQPRHGLAIFIIMALLSMARIFLGQVPVSLELRHLVVGCALVFAVMALAPVPWQWTGNGRKLARGLRGLIQALVWNGAWLALLLAVLAPMRRVSTPPYLLRGNPVRAQVLQTFQGHPRIQGILAPLVGLLPVVLLAGWLMAAFQAADAEREEAEAGRRTLERAARDAQEQALKAQLDPHVLYNALGGISELIRDDPDRAEASVLSLAALYRRLTDLGKRAEVTLGEERSLVADYLGVEQFRLGDRLRVEWDWPTALDARPVPPLLIQPLVENAIKHGLAPRREGGRLVLSAAADGAGLRFRVANDGVPLAPAWTPGTGLANLTQRLALLGGGSRLELRGDGAWTVAELLLLPGGRP